MSVPSDGSVHGNSIEALQQELAATNVLLLGLGRELSADRVETAVRVEGLRAEQARERRVRMMYVAGVGTTVVVLYDQHIEHCSPGARVVNGLDYLLTHPPKGTQQEQKQAFEAQYNHAPLACDVTVPFHTHDGSHWPTGADVVGMALLGVVVVATAVYHRWRTGRDYARVQLAMESEEKHVASGVS